MAQITVLDADEAEVAVELPLAPGRGAAAASKPVVLSTEDKTALDAAVTALQIVDDWDESDRAKVNLIVGQAGITAGAGNVEANTPRVTLAADDPLVSAVAGVADDVSAAAINGSIIGGRVHKTQPSAAPTTGNMKSAFIDAIGRIVMNLHTNPESMLVSGVKDISAGTEVELFADPGASPLRNYVTTVLIDNPSATKLYVNLLDGSGGTAMIRIPVPAESGAIVNFSTPLKQTTASTALYADASTAATGLAISAVGYMQGI